jgi:hypothetical protein
VELEPTPAPTTPVFDLDRDNVTLTGLLAHASEAWSRDLASWVLAVFLSFVGTGVVVAAQFIWNVVSGIQGADGGSVLAAVDTLMDVLFQVLQTAVSGVFTMGFVAMGVRALNGKKANIGALFSQISKVWKVLVQSFVIVVGIALIVLPIVVVILLMFVGPVTLDTPMDEIVDKAGRPFAIAGLIFLPVYVYLVLGIVFAQTELAFNDESGPISALVYSWRIARGRRLRILGVSIVAGLIMLGSMMLCGIGLFFGLPFATLLYVALYLALRNGADVPRAVTASTLGRDY